jgi:membrane protease YdiL (CAAX protease family)
MHDPVPTPPRPGLWHAWSRLRVLGLAAFLIAANFTVQLVVYGLGGGLMLPVLAGALLGVGLPLVLLHRGGVLAPRADLGLDRPGAATVVLATVMALAALAPTSLLAELTVRLHPVSPEWAALYDENLPRGPAGVALAFLAVVVAAPLAEEVIFRALLQRLAASLWGGVPGLVVAALAFGLVHGEPWYLLGLIGVGAVLGTVWLATGSLTACWIAHAVHNGVSLAWLLAQGQVTTEPTAVTTGDWVLAGISCVVLLTAGRILMRRRPDHR